jgi:hypothetical protein
MGNFNPRVQKRVGIDQLKLQYHQLDRRRSILVASSSENGSDYKFKIQAFAEYSIFADPRGSTIAVKVESLDPQCYGKDP